MKPKPSAWHIYSVVLEMPILRRSQFVHVLQLGDDRALLIHALSHLRLPVDAEIVRLVAWFEQDRSFPEMMPSLQQEMGYDAKTMTGCLAALIERDVLTEKSVAQELAETTAKLRETHGRDPAEMLERYRRTQKEGAHPYWSVAAPYGLSTFKPDQTHLELLVFGDCEVQMEVDFLRREAARRQIDLRVAATFSSDTSLAGERKCDAIIVGALNARKTISAATRHEEQDCGPLHYVSEARSLIGQLR